MKYYIMSIILLMLVACGGENSTVNDTENELLIAAPANLLFAFEEVGKNFEEQYDTKITFSFGASGQLADQMEHGAPFDIFASADENYVDKLIELGNLDPVTKRIYGIGRIGISSLIPIETLEELLLPEIKKIAIANPDHAPYGIAAKEALQSIGIWDELKDKLIYSRNISEALTMLETQNVEASIIALSLKKEDYHFSLIDDSLHSPLKQAIAINQDSQNHEVAITFIEYLGSAKGKEILEKYGFVVSEGE